MLRPRKPVAPVARQRSGRSAISVCALCKQVIDAVTMAPNSGILRRCRRRASQVAPPRFAAALLAAAFPLSPCRSRG